MKKTVAKHAFVSAVSLLSLALLFGEVTPAQAAESLPDTSASFASPAEALISEIAAHRLEKFSSRLSFSVREWFEPAGAKDIAPIDLALHTGQIRFVPENIRKSPEMAAHRWTRYNGETFLSRALKDGHADWIVNDADFKNPASFWNRDVEGVPAAYRLIEDRALDAIPSALFRAMPYTYWRDTRVNEQSLIGRVAQNKYLLKAFFAPDAWAGRLEEMKKIFDWAVEELGAARTVSGKPDKALQRKLDTQYKEALETFESQYKRAQSKTREVERRKKPDVQVSLPGSTVFIPS